MLNSCGMLVNSRTGFAGGTFLCDAIGSLAGALDPHGILRPGLAITWEAYSYGVRMTRMASTKVRAFRIVLCHGDRFSPV
jgi:hypothetical protein